MKQLFLCVIPLLLGSILGGCSKEENASDGVEQTIVVKLPGSVGTRAVETSVANEAKTQTLTDIRVFLLAGTHVITTETFSSEEISNKMKRMEQVASNVDKVIVVANANGENISGLTNASAIRNYAFTVASQYPTGATGLEGKTLIGEGVPQVSNNDPGTNDPTHKPTHTYKEVEVSLNAITSRIEVGHVKAGTGIEDIQLLGVYVNNYFATHADKANNTAPVLNKFDWGNWPTIPASPAKQAIPFDPATGIDPSTYSEPLYVDRYNAAVELDDLTKAYAYHVFSGNLPHVILLVKGKYAAGHIPSEDGTNDPMPYFIGWVTFTKYSTSPDVYIPEMSPNFIYKMGVDVNGIVINAPDVRPVPEPEDYDLGIKVQVTPWTVQVVTPEV